MIYLIHGFFALCMAFLCYAMLFSTAENERLVRGLELARKAEAEAARHRMTMAFEAQQEATDKLRKLIEESQCAIRRSESLIGAGAVRARGSDQPMGHAQKKGL
jgi:hypothetical protein